jgi:hypothetical protein
MKTKKYWILLVVFVSFRTVSGVPALSQGEKDQTEYIQNLNARIQQLQEMLRETKKTLMNRDRELKERERQYEERVRQMKEIIEGNQKTMHDMAELLQELNNKYKRIVEKNIEQRKKLRAYEVVKSTSEIVVEPLESWRPSGGWGSVDRRYTRNARIETTTGHPRFVVEDANSLHVWLRSDVRVPISKYPIAVLKYRAENIGQDWYCIWMNDGTGPYNGCEVFELADLTADGKTHEIRFDLRKERLVHTGRTKKLNEKGTIKGMALGVKSGEATPAYVEIIDLRFLQAGPVEMPVLKDEKAVKEIVVSLKETVVSPKEVVAAPKEIVVSPIGPWSPARGWGGDLYRSTRNARTNKTNGHLEFIVEDANSLHVWKRYGLSVSIADYPILVFTYRARNVAPGWYTLWMDDGAGPWGGCIVFRPGNLIVDGKKHEIHADLRKVRDEHKHKILKLYEKGTIKGMALGVRAGNKTPAVLEFIDLRFLPEK